MKVALLAILLAVAAAAPAQAARVELMVVGASGVLRDAKPVTLKRTTVDVGRRRCRLAAATPLAALARTSLVDRLKLRDYGSCSKRPRDAGGLYLRGIDRQVERGRDGWVYKVGRRTPGVGAADTSNRLRDAVRVLWFWCRSGASGCQRTLDVTPDRVTVAAGERLTVTVRAHDDNGAGIAAVDATVRLGSAIARTDAAGVAVLTVPAGSTTLSAVATMPGAVRSFPAEVRVR